MSGIIGYWAQTWLGEPPHPPTNANVGIAFSGWTNVDNALSESAAIHDSLQGAKYISLGGGNENGSFSAAAVQNITAAIQAGRFSAYDGIAYDVEEGEGGLSQWFAESFSVAKAKGLKVIVTVSHSAPYGVPDAAALMQSFFTDSNIDYLSPQLYTSGSETENDFTPGVVPWSDYAKSRAPIVPSIVTANLYPSAQQFFADLGIATAGFIQWNNG
ncbi:hypothetical protein [Chromobacterium sp. IIBBL 290-4]|uniref:hypothetical protein n=1 Tax=Chromobacterium sp. IIBBL 290-4 TaxID=2953890 RepID=UPI0020B8FBD6|nr:hypothetical protein [Chromobacterium sp. IIBBL 290-4]UTH75731.1 hypothetical protein NKT35_06430 [Chromobacterium sp. IIBBL 290-4]